MTLVASAIAGSSLALAEDASLPDYDSLLAPLHSLAGTQTNGSVPRSLQADAKAIRARLEADLGADLPVCPEYDPLQGVVVARPATDEASPAELHPLLERLGSLLDHSDAALRDAAAYVLGEIGPQAAAIINPRVEGHRDRSLWLTHAAGLVGCEQWSMDGPLDQLAEPLRLQAEARAQHEQWPLLLAANMLRDAERVWPDRLISSLLDYNEIAVMGVKPKLVPPPALNPVMDEALLDLEAVASDPARDVALRLEVLELLSGARNLGPAAAPLRALMAHANDRISYASASVLIRSENPFMAEALLVLLQRHQFGLLWERPDLFCAQGIDHPDLLRILSDRLRGSDWREAKEAANWLACARSAGAPPALLAALAHPSWEVVQAAITALTSWLEQDAAVRVALTDVAATHWSGLVRGQARIVLHGPEGPSEPAQPKADDELQVITIGGHCFSRCLTDHLNAACGVDGDVADGLYQSTRLGRFPVVWQRARRHPPPPGFPATLNEMRTRPDYGTNSFLPVDDGWLVGTDLWHYDGLIAHVGQDGAMEQISRFGEDAVAILDTPRLGRIVLGGSLFGLGEGGLLASIVKETEGWALHYRSSLPSPPWAWAYAPDGTLLVADPHNAIAVHADWQLEALSCPTRGPATLPNQVLEVALQAAGSPLPLRMRAAELDAAVRSPLVDEARHQLLAARSDPSKLGPGESEERIERDYQSAVQGLVDAWQLKGDAEAALSLLDDPLFASGPVIVGQRAALLVEAGRLQEAREYLKGHQHEAQYISQFMLAALAVIDGDRESANARLQLTWAALLKEAEDQHYVPEPRYIDILDSIVNGQAAINRAGGVETLEPGWPDPLAAFLRGEISEAELVPNLYLPDGQVDRQRLCEALVYLGIRDSMHGRHARANRHYAAARELSIHDFIEHTIALLMLSRE